MSASLEIFDRSAQGRGSFDGGRITEYKVIGMPQDGARRKRVGPLFYWAWATGAPGAVIGLHPHQGFEIFSYVLKGTLIHRDTLGSDRPVAAGGLQLMRTGSGVSHEEAMGDAETEFFQIWLEPNLAEAVLRPADYADFREADFPVETRPGARVKRILGPDAPPRITVEVEMLDVEIDPGGAFDHAPAEGRAFAAVTMTGSGSWTLGDGEPAPVSRGDLCVVENPGDGEAVTRFTAEADGARVALLDTPLTVGYPLYPSR